MSEKITMPKNVQAFVYKYGGIGCKEQDAAFWKDFRKAANAYADVQAKRICDLEHAFAEAREQRDRLAEAVNRASFFESAMCEQGKIIENLAAQRDRLAEVAVLATQLDTSQTCDPDHHTLVVMAIKALQSLTPNAEL